jgi:ABC-2 type transport system ATP-binding protein
MNQQSDLVNSTEGLSKSYHGVVALEDLDLRVPRHAIFGFLGPNGAGKSTTIRLLLGLSRPTRGSATIFGLDSVRDGVAIRERVGYLAQEPRFYDHMTARETLRFAARFFYDGPADLIEERVVEVLDLVGLDDRADRPIKGFSGGERQRLGIAQAQVSYPDLLILDEPAAALDPMGRRDVLEVMERLRKQATIFYSTHILDDVQRVSDSVAIMNHGRLVAQATIAELLAGAEGAVYTLTLIGDAAGAQARLADQPWVISATMTSAPRDPGGATILEVHVRNLRVAEAQLLPLVLEDGQTTVAAFGRKQHKLEDVFVQMVEGGNPNGRG